jgi:pyrimidine operon attenuation protein/uracil phosphoribosyltransferase
LIDRGGRQLPVAADYVAKQINVADHELLILQKTDDGRLSLTVDHA